MILSQNQYSVYVEDADLNIYPDIRAPHPVGTRLVLGDVHANLLKILYFLIKENVIALDKVHYDAIQVTYNSLELVGQYGFSEEDKRFTKQAFTRLVELFDFIQIKKPNSQQGNHSDPLCFVTFIGDIFCDRGYNDGITIMLFFKLHELKLPFNIISSNHDMSLLSLYQNLIKPDYEKIIEIKLSASYRSLTRFWSTLRALDFDEQSFIRFVEFVYIPSLVLLTYDLTYDQKNIILYSHAPIKFEEVKHIADYLHLTYEDKTALDLAQVISGINIRFQEKLKNNEILYPLINYKLYHPLTNIHWFRHQYTSGVKLGLNKPKINVPKLPYTVDFIHGHDEHGVYQDAHSCSLDTLLGKLKALNRMDNGYKIIVAPLNELPNEVILLNPISKAHDNATALNILAQAAKSMSLYDNNQGKVFITARSVVNTVDEENDDILRPAKKPKIP